MQRVLRNLAVLVLLLAASSCSWEMESPGLKDKLTTWSDQVFDWQNRTYQVICELETAIDPDPGTWPGPLTQAYCGTGEGGEPDPPPEW